MVPESVNRELIGDGQRALRHAVPRHRWRRVKTETVCCTFRYTVDQPWSIGRALLSSSRVHPSLVRVLLYSFGPVIPFLSLAWRP